MFKKKWLIIFGLLFSTAGYSQVPADTIPASNDHALAIDTSFDYDDLLSDFADFLDSILAPRSYFLANVAVTESYFNYQIANRIFAQKKLVFSPTVGYYHKSGPGITLSGSLARPDYRKEQDFGFYQYAITPSYDFIQSRKWTAGVSYTRFITKDSLKFYTTPIQNEINAFFVWRKSWVQPGIAFNSGWGSRSEAAKRVEFLKALRWLKRYRNANGLGNPPPIPITTVTTTDESIIDFSVTGSVRHTFYWLELLGKKDLLRFTPMLSFTGGTQRYGFNQTSATYAGNLRATQYNKGEVSLDENLKFQPLSITLYLRPEYSIGKFFIQPQFILDYYFPAAENNLSALFSVNAGLMF